MSGRQRNAVKSGILLIIGAGLSLFAWFTQPIFFILLMCVIVIILLIAGAQSLDSWHQRRKAVSKPKKTVSRPKNAVSKPKSAKRRHEAKPGTRQGVSVEQRLPDPHGSGPGFYGMIPLSMLPGGSDEKPAKRRRLTRRDKRRSEQLPPDATVTLAAERQEANVDELFDALNRELVGLVPVKKKIEEIAALLLVDRVRQRFGLEAPRPNLHMCFTGSQGRARQPWR